MEAVCLQRTRYGTIQAVNFCCCLSGELEDVLEAASKAAAEDGGLFPEVDVWSAHRSVTPLGGGGEAGPAPVDAPESLPVDEELVAPVLLSQDPLQEWRTTVPAWLETVQQAGNTDPGSDPAQEETQGDTPKDTREETRDELLVAPVLLSRDPLVEWAAVVPAWHESLQQAGRAELAALLASVPDGLEPSVPVAAMLEGGGTPPDAKPLFSGGVYGSDRPAQRSTAHHAAEQEGSGTPLEAEPLFSGGVSGSDRPEQRATAEPALRAAGGAAGNGEFGLEAALDVLSARGLDSEAAALRLASEIAVGHGAVADKTAPEAPDWLLPTELPEAAAGILPAKPPAAATPTEAPFGVQEAVVLLRGRGLDLEANSLLLIADLQASGVAAAVAAADEQAPLEWLLSNAAPAAMPVESSQPDPLSVPRHPDASFGVEEALLLLRARGMNLEAASLLQVADIEASGVAALVAAAEEKARLDWLLGPTTSAEAASDLPVAEPLPALDDATPEASRDLSEELSEGAEPEGDGFDVAAAAALLRSRGMDSEAQSLLLMAEVETSMAMVHAAALEASADQSTAIPEDELGIEAAARTLRSRGMGAEADSLLLAASLGSGEAAVTADWLLEISRETLGEISVEESLPPPAEPVPMLATAKAATTAPEMKPPPASQDSTSQASASVGSAPLSEISVATAEPPHQAPLPTPESGAGPTPAAATGPAARDDEPAEALPSTAEILALEMRAGGSSTGASDPPRSQQQVRGRIPPGFPVPAAPSRTKCLCDKACGRFARFVDALSGSGLLRRATGWAHVTVVGAMILAVLVSFLFQLAAYNRGAPSPAPAPPDPEPDLDLDTGPPPESPDSPQSSGNLPFSLATVCSMTQMKVLNGPYS